MYQKSHHWNKHLGSHQILWTILKIGLGETETNRRNDKEVDDYEEGLTPERWHCRKGKVRGLISIEDCVDASIQGLEEYIKKAKKDWSQQPIMAIVT